MSFWRSEEYALHMIPGSTWVIDLFFFFFLEYWWYSSRFLSVLYIKYPQLKWVWTGPMLQLSFLWVGYHVKHSLMHEVHPLEALNWYSGQLGTMCASLCNLRCTRGKTVALLCLNGKHLTKLLIPAQAAFESTLPFQHQCCSCLTQIGWPAI